MTYFQVLSTVAIACCLGLVSCQSAESLTTKAENFEKENKLEDAEINYRRALQKDANSAALHNKLGRVLVQRGKQREALSMLLRASEMDPANLDWKRDSNDVLLEIFLQSKSRPKSIYEMLQKNAEAFLAEDPRSFDGLRIRGTLELADRKYSEAIVSLQQALREDSKHLQTNLTLVEALYLGNKQEEAATLAKDLLERFPNSLGAFNRLYGIYTSSNKVAEGAKLLEEKLLVASNKSATMLQMVRHALLYEKDEAKANRLIERLGREAQFTDGAVLASRFLLEQRHLEASVKMARESLSRGAQPAIELRKIEADALRFLGKPVESQQALLEALKLKPGDPDVQIAQAILLIDAGKPESIAQALAALQKLKEANVDNPELDFQFGRALAMSGRTPESVKSFQEAVRKQRSHVGARFALIGHALSQRQFGEALSQLDQVDIYSPDDLKAVNYRVSILRATNRASEAEDLVRRLLVKYPANVELTEQQALLSLDGKRYSEAAALFQKVYDSGNHNMDVVAGLTRSLKERGQTQAAMSLLDREIAAKPQALPLKSIRADLMAETGRVPDAIAVYEKLSADPGAPSLIWRRLGELQMQTGAYAKAAKSFSQQAQLDKDGTAYAAWTKAAELAGDLTEAGKACEAWIPTAKNDWAALNNCAFIMAENGSNLERAEQMARQALTQQPNHPNVQDTLAWVMVKRKNYGQAGQIYNQLTGRYPNTPSFRFHSAMAHIGSSQTDQARKELEAALKAKPVPMLAERIRKALDAL